MKIFIPLAFAFALGVALGLIFVPPTMLSDSYAVDSAAVAAEGGQTAATKPVIIPNSYIVILKPEFVGEPPAGDQGLSNSSLKKQEQEILIEADQAEDLIEDQGGNVTQIYDRALNGFAVEGVKDITPLVQDPAVDSIQPDQLEFPQKQYYPDALDRLDLDRALTTAYRPDSREDRPNIDVAVVDTYVDAFHPDLNVVQRVNFRPCGSNTPSGLMVCDAGGGHHGTHVAGSIAAKDNLGGIVGGMPGARIWSLGICSDSDESGGCPDSAIFGAWDYLVAHGSEIEIANMSVGGGGTVSSATQTAGNNVANAGVTMFVSAGNNNGNVNDLHFCGVDAFICVSALADTNGKCGGGGPDRHNSLTWGWSHDDYKASFSSYGSDVDIMAPGVNVLSTLPGDTSIGDPTTGATTSTGSTSGQTVYIGTSGQGKYGVSSGTSMSSPIAAGIGALIKLKNPSFTPAQVKADMQAKAYSQTQSCDGFGKGGLVSGANSKSSEKVLYAQPY